MPRSRPVVEPCPKCGTDTRVAELEAVLRSTAVRRCRPCAGLSPTEDARRQRRHNQGRRFGLTEAEVRQLIGDQQGMCAICDRMGYLDSQLVIDHDHSTGLVRGLLCSQCNSALGLFNDSPATLAAAIFYLGRAHGFQGIGEGWKPVSRRVMMGRYRR